MIVQLILGYIMAQTSIHFQPVRGGSEAHNKREKELDYIHKERSSMNEYWQKDSQAARLASITQNYLRKHPRRTKLHAKATPIREAVVVIEDTTTMDDLQNLAQRLQQRFGIDVFQIAIHKDEGYKNSKQQLKLNLHAHLVADWTDHEKGESIKLSRQDMAEMQTICAEVLGMERGRSSDKKHLSALQYKTKAEEERAQVMEEENRKAAQELEEARAKKAKNLFDDDDVAVIRDSMLELIELQPKASVNEERLAIINVCQEWECNPTFDSVEQLLTNTSNTWTEIVENKDISGD